MPIWHRRILALPLPPKRPRRAPDHKAKDMTDTLPDRLSVNPDSPFYDAEVLAKDIGIRFKGTEKTNVEEYCVSEGWVRMAVGNSRDRFGNPMTVKASGPVEPYFRDTADGAETASDN